MAKKSKFGKSYEYPTNEYSKLKEEIKKPEPKQTIDKYADKQVNSLTNGETLEVIKILGIDLDIWRHFKRFNPTLYVKDFKK